MIGVVDYGLSNIRSIVHKLKKLGFESKVVSGPEDIPGAKKLILPGVGHFAQGMDNLRSRKLIEPLTEVVQQGMPILGICLGMQLMTEFSEEGQVSGLGWVGGRTEKFKPSDDRRYRIPHVGWNVVKAPRSSKLFSGLSQELRFYFTHSYAVQLKNRDDSIGQTDYLGVFDSAFEVKNIWGTQFHPEKSHQLGLMLLKNFCQ